MVVLMLRRHGYEVLEAITGADALLIASGRRVDLVLTDVLMPDISGFALAEALHTHDAGLPVLFMSGDIGRHFDKGGRTDPGTTLLQKPFEEATLLKPVGAALRSSSASAVDSPTSKRPAEAG